MIAAQRARVRLRALLRENVALRRQRDAAIADAEHMARILGEVVSRQQREIARSDAAPRPWRPTMKLIPGGRI